MHCHHRPASSTHRLETAIVGMLGSSGEGVVDVVVVVGAVWRGECVVIDRFVQ